MGPIKFKWVNQLNIYVEKGDSSLGGNVFLGLMEFHESAFLVHYLKSADLFVDVGANLGHYTLLASGICGSKTIAIEPVPNTFQKLCYNIKKNNIQKLVTMKNIGVGDEDGKLNFTDFNNNAINFVKDNSVKNKLSISSRTLNKLLKDKIPNVMKIDVEGYELFTLLGANKILSHKKLNMIIIEINGHCHRYGHKENDIYEYISKFGFKPIFYNPINKKITLLNKFNRYSDNTIFIKNIKDTNKRISNGNRIHFKNNHSI